MNPLALDHSPTFTFDDFMAWYPEKSTIRYELHQGNIVAMPKPKGKHSEIAGFLMGELNFEIKRLGLPYLIPRECVIKCGEFSGYEPDVVVLDKERLKDEPRWQQESTIIYGETALLVIEVVSSNWSDDYALKLDAYESLGIQEYWIVDYLGLGGRKFIGYSKQPTLSVYQLNNGDYSVMQYRDNELIQFLLLPDLNLSIKSLFLLH